MEANKRWVNLTYAAGTFIAFVLFQNLFTTVFGSLGVRNTHLLGKGFTLAHLIGAVSALVFFFWAWRHPRWRPQLNETVDELSKVTWPTWDETRLNARMTILVTLIISLILWLFDVVFGNLTNLILGGS